MANILGSLFVELKANTAEFVTGMSKASASAKATGKDIEDTFSRLGSVAATALAPLGAVGQQLATTLENIGSAAGKAMGSMGSLGAIATGAATAAAGLGAALVGAAIHAADVGNKIYEASQKTGLSAASLSGLMAIAKQTGGNFDSLTTAITRATVNFEKTTASAGKLNPELFKAMGGAKGVAELGLKPMDDRIQIVLKSIFAMNDTWERNRVLSELLGKGWMENTEQLKMLADEGFGGAIEKAKEMGVFFGPDAAAQAHAFYVQVETLKSTFGAMATTIGQTLIPALTDLINSFFNLQGAMRDSATDAEKWDEDLRAYVGGAVALFTKPGGGASTWANQFVSSGAIFRRELQQQTNELVTAAGANEKDRAAAEKLAAAQKLAAAAHIPVTTALYDLAHNIHPKVAAATDATTDKTNQLKSALDRAAESSRSFWEKFNAGVAEAKTEFPKVLDLFKEVRDYQDEMDRKASTAERRSMVEHLATGTTPGGAAVAAAGLPPAFAPTFPGAPMPLSTDELTFAMNRIKAAPPEVSASLDTMRAHFEDLFNSLAAEGKDFGPKVFDSLHSAIDGISTQLTKLVITGKSNFRQLFESLASEITKASIQNLLGKLVFAPLAAAAGGGAAVAGGATPGGAAAGGIFGKIFGGLAGGGGKRGESTGSPLYVSVVNPLAGAAGAAPGVIGSILSKLGGGKQSGGGGFALGALGNFDWSGSAGASAGAEATGGGGLGGLFASIGSSVGKAFGGFLQGGGDVTPGRAYVVGERAPEFFVPNAPGQIRPSLDVGGRGGQTTIVNNFNGVKDVDLFRRSESQIMTQFHRQSAIAYARHG